MDPAVREDVRIGQAEASGAVGAALPLLMGALGRNAEQPQGAEALFGALQRNHSGLDIGSVLGSVLGGASTPEANGAGILGHIFGGSQPRAEAGLGQATGLDSNRAGQLLKILAEGEGKMPASKLSKEEQKQVLGYVRSLAK